MNAFSIWDPVEFTTGTCATWEMGHLCLWVEQYEREWHILPVYTDDKESARPAFSIRDKTEKPKVTEWVHYVVHDCTRALPVPAMMDRPIVIRPDRLLVLIPGERAQFFLALPLSFRLMGGPALIPAGTPDDSARAKKLAEFQIFPLANAWFGDPVSGELCYFNSARLFSDFAQIPASTIHAVCPILISNESDRDLSFDRICLHTEFLGIYRGSSRFWTNEVSVVFKGAEQETRIQPSKAAPSLEGLTTLVSLSRQPIENWHFKKTFSMLKQITGF